jgi:hypothetical protein
LVSGRRKYLSSYYGIELGGLIYNPDDKNHFVLFVAPRNFPTSLIRKVDPSYKKGLPILLSERAISLINLGRRRWSI